MPHDCVNNLVNLPVNEACLSVTSSEKTPYLARNYN